MASLTPREQQVLGQILSGKTSKVIALELKISDRTVETHRKKIMDKMQARSLAELIQMAVLHLQRPVFSGTNPKGMPGKPADNK
jgi:FixJ family two-component response regulator